jgi:hypothetical protein
MFQRDPRFIRFRSAREIGVDIFLRESHELLLLSEEIVETRIHRYVQYTQGGGGWRWRCMYRGEKERRVGLNEGGSSIKGPWEEPVTLLASVEKRIVPLDWESSTLMLLLPRAYAKREGDELD